MEFRNGLRDGIPICLGYFAVSFAFGILCVNEGLTALEAMLISLTNLTSAGQFAGLTIMASMGSLVEMAVSQLVINSRYMLMSISLSQKVDQTFSGIWRWILGYGVTDEIYAVAISKDSVSRSYFAGLIITPVIGWTAGTLCGAVLGNILPAVITNALGVALYGMFIAIVIPAARDSRPVLVAALIAVVIRVVLYYVPVFSSISGGFAIIICTLVASAAAAILHPIEEEEEETA
jgi:predicted branched-subunit amino acid permease